jgi:plastocyanin
MTRRALPYAGAAALLLALVVAPLLAATPGYAARTVTISLTATGPKPATAIAGVGDTVTFTNDDATFVHEVANKSPNWTFDSRPLAPGQSFTTGPLSKPGDYDYQGVNLDSFTGRVSVPAAATSVPPSAPAPSPAPSSGSSATPKPATSGGAAGGSPSPSSSPAPAGLVPPPYAGGFGALGASGSPAPGSSAPPPAVAPVLPGAESAGPAPGGAGLAVGRGRLPEPATGRRYGLPAALAAIGALGVASLLGRLLLAHPAARRAAARTAGTALPEGPGAATGPPAGAPS